MGHLLDQIIEAFADHVVFVSKVFIEILDCVEQYLHKAKDTSL